jgi:anti-anti-sigma factor
MTEKLQVSVSQAGAVVVVATDRYINIETERLVRACRKHLDRGSRAILLDLSGTKIINSIGLSLLIEIIEAAIEVGGRVAFCSLTPTIERTFAIMGVLAYAEAFPDRITALASFGVLRKADQEIPLAEGGLATEKKVVLASATEQLIAALQKDIDLIYSIGAEQFELLICDRLDAMGFEVRRVGHTFAPDGGVDIVSWPKKSVFPYLFAVQVKHRQSPSRKVGPGPVKDLMAVLQTSPFDAGLLVTNTSFTPDAVWWSQHGPRLLRLRDFKDLQKWLAGNFLDGSLREFPREIELAPGITVRLR